MSSLSSLQGSPIFSQSPLEPIFGQATCFPFAEEFQKACEESNSVAIWDLVQRGANPNQPLKYTQKISEILTRDYVKQMLCVEEYKEFLKNSYTMESLDEVQNEDIKAQLMNLISRLQNEEDISDNEVIDLSTTFCVMEAFEAEKEFDDIQMHPLLIALALHDFDLARGLIQAGADPKDPLFLDQCVALCINEQYENVLDFLIQQGLNEEELSALKSSRQEFESMVLGQDEEDVDWDQIYNDFLVEEEVNNSFQLETEIL